MDSHLSPTKDNGLVRVRWKLEVGRWLIKGTLNYQLWPSAEPAHVDFIDLERDSAIRELALMALTAYSVRQCLSKLIIALAY